MPFDYIDHLVYAAPDLGESVEDLGQRLGLSLQPGGAHPGLGTANYLMSLGGTTYLEVIGPDPDQPDPDRPRPFGIDSLKAPGLVSWAITTPGIDSRCRKAVAAGYDPGPVLDMSRETPAGDLLQWRLSLPGKQSAGGLVPFLIDWGKTPSPALGLPAACHLTDFNLQHPEPAKVQGKLDALGLPMTVGEGPRKLAARIQTPRGEIELV